VKAYDAPARQAENFAFGGEFQMKTIPRVAAVTLCLVTLLLAPALLFAQSPFDGTWHTNMDQSKLSPKPIVFAVQGGMYDCSSCVPKINVKADGQPQSVTGQTYDSISVHVIDVKSVEVMTKKNGKPEYEQTRTVSDDGKSLAVKTTSHPKDSDQTVTSAVTLTRIGKAPAGSNGTSGSWRLDKINESENGLTTTYKSNGDELTMSTPTGESYTAKLDGKDYPAKGAYSYDSVSLKRINDHTIEETDKRDGKVVEVSKITVASDGKTMTVVATSKLTGRVSTYVAQKQ
jgi:hypothetical protein